LCPVRRRWRRISGSVREGIAARRLYSTAWESLDAKYEKYPVGPDIDPPERLREMVEIAEALGAEADFVRVDLYSIGRRIVFGEPTSYPEAANAPFDPPEFDRVVGEWWTLPTTYWAARAG